MKFYLFRGGSNTPMLITVVVFLTTIGILCSMRCAVV